MSKTYLTRKDKIVLKRAAIGAAMSDWQMGGKPPIYDEITIHEHEKLLFYQIEYLKAYNTLQRGHQPKLHINRKVKNANSAR